MRAPTGVDGWRVRRIEKSGDEIDKSGLFSHLQLLANPTILANPDDIGESGRNWLGPAEGFVGKLATYRYWIGPSVLHVRHGFALRSIYEN